MAKKYHPDTNKDTGARERFQEVNEAYEVIYYFVNKIQLFSINCTVISSLSSAQLSCDQYHGLPLIVNDL